MATSDNKGPKLNAASVAHAMERLDAPDFTSEEWVDLFVSLLSAHMTLERIHGGSKLFNELCEAFYRSPSAVLGDIEVPVMLEDGRSIMKTIWYNINTPAMQGLAENPMCPLWAETNDSNFEEMLEEGIPIQVECAMFQCFDMKQRVFHLQLVLDKTWKKLGLKYRVARDMMVPGQFETNCYQMISSFVRSGLLIIAADASSKQKRLHKMQDIWVETFEILGHPAPRTALSFLTDK